MNIRPLPTLPAPAGERGAAALLIVLVLLLGMTIIALTASRSGMVEQQITGNDIRAREVQEAAEAGLEYGIAWGTANTIADGVTTCPGGTGCPTLEEITDSTSNENYTISALTFTKNAGMIRVTSTAIGSTDNTITATSEAYIKPDDILTDDGKKPPPVVMDGCMSSTTGTPDIYPNWNDIDGDGIKDTNEWNDVDGDGVADAGEWTDTNGNGVVDNEVGRAIMTSQPEVVGGNFCLDYCGSGGGAGCPPTSGGGSQTHANLHNGVLQNNIVFPDNSIWNYYFDISQAQFQAAASTTLSTDGGLYWITGTGNWPGGTYGSETNPVIIVFVNDCPKPSGNTTIYGILFFLEVNGCVTNPMNGWGSVIIYGSLGFNGGVNKMNANLEIHGTGDGIVMQTINFLPLDASRLPGTWKDF